MELVELIKKIAVNAIEAKKPVNVSIARITELNPLTVQINPKMVLSSQLIITQTIQDMIDGYYIGEGKRSFLISETSSAEGVTPGELRRLTVGDKVLLIRVQGGQKFIVMDKVI